MSKLRANGFEKVTSGHYEFRNLNVVFLFSLKWIKIGETLGIEDWWRTHHTEPFMYIHLFTNRTEDLLVACNENVSSYYYYYYYYFLCPTFFSEMVQWIVLKLSGFIQYKKSTRRFFHFLKFYFRSSNMAEKQISLSSIIFRNGER
jgi:hypothetical protein